MAKRLQSQTLTNMCSKKPRITESSTIPSGGTESDHSETVELSRAEEDLSKRLALVLYRLLILIRLIAPTHDFGTVFGKLSQPGER